MRFRNQINAEPFEKLAGEGLWAGSLDGSGGRQSIRRWGFRRRDTDQQGESDKLNAHF
jgi:hypothetical protein